MSRWGAVAIALGIATGGDLAAQRPTVSPALERAARRDTTIAVWFFGREAYGLDAVAAAVMASGGRVRRRSEWLHAVSALLPTDRLAAARQRPEFRHLQPVATLVGPRPVPAELDVIPTAAPPDPAAGTTDASYGAAQMQMRRLNLFPIARRGVRGARVTIALLDSGFETQLPAFATAQVLAQWDFVSNDSIVRNQTGDAPDASHHGTQVWSLLAANAPDTVIGIAPEARFLLAKTEDIRTERRTEEDNFVAALEWAFVNSADIVSTSLGYLRFDDGFFYTPAQLNGDVAVTTVAADLAAQRGMVVIAAAGNCGNGGTYCITSGFRSLTTPADGDSVIAVGAEDSVGTLAAFSSRGPTADGRLKPDVVAPGVAVLVVHPGSATGYARFSGTSYAAPLAAGIAALMKQLHPTLAGPEIAEGLKRVGSNRTTPDSSIGWGRPDGAAAVIFPLGIAVTEPADSVMTSVTPEFRWTAGDVPAFARPVRYRTRVTRDSTAPVVLLDTAVTDETPVRLLRAQPPDTRLFVQITATTPDGVVYASPPEGPFIAPAWATLTTLDDPAGVFVRDLRPEFRWDSPFVAEPPGPFQYTIEVLRDDDGTVEIAATGLAERRFRPSRDLERNTPYRWRVISRLGADSAVTESRGTFVILDASVPTLTVLYQNFPNPFPNPATGTSTTCIWFDLATASPVRLEVLDLQGRVLKTLIPNGDFRGPLPPGRYGRPAVDVPGRCDPRLEWDGSARDARRLPRGVYLVRLETDVGTFFRRVVFLGQP